MNLNVLKNKIDENFLKIINNKWSTTILPICCYIFLFFLIYFFTVPTKTNSIFNDMKNIDMIKLESNIKIEDLSANQGIKFQVPIDIRTEYDKNHDPVEILTSIFKKADTNNDKKIQIKELTKWINFKIKQHISRAIKNNHNLFNLIDISPRNGLVTWKEYHVYYLKQKGFQSNYVRNHDETNHVGLNRNMKEQIMRDKAFWRETARVNQDSLTLNEFLAFMHPESSATNQIAYVEEVFDKFDLNADEILTEDEFLQAKLNDNGDTLSILFRQSEMKRRDEFRNVIDLNKDGHADRMELLRYVAPQNPRRSELEAQSLIAQADIDHDEALSLDEILSRKDLFMTSKMVSTARSFHDEFK